MPDLYAKISTAASELSRLLEQAVKALEYEGLTDAQFDQLADARIAAEDAADIIASETSEFSEKLEAIEEGLTLLEEFQPEAV